MYSGSIRLLSHTQAGETLCSRQLTRAHSSLYADLLVKCLCKSGITDPQLCSLAGAGEPFDEMRYLYDLSVLIHRDCENTATLR